MLVWDGWRTCNRVMFSMRGVCGRRQLAASANTPVAMAPRKERSPRPGVVWEPWCSAPPFATHPAARVPPSQRLSRSPSGIAAAQPPSPTPSREYHSQFVLARPPSFPKRTAFGQRAPPLCPPRLPTPSQQLPSLSDGGQRYTTRRGHPPPPCHRRRHSLHCRPPRPPRPARPVRHTRAARRRRPPHPPTVAP